MAIKEDKIGQTSLLPTDLRDLIPVDHICYLVVAIVNCMDVSEVENKYRSKPRQSGIFTPNAAKAGYNGVY